MTESTWNEIREAIYRRWPSLRGEPHPDDDVWGPQVRRDFAAAVRRMNIDATQADAALAALAMRCRSKKPFPREIVEAFERAQGPRASSGGGEDTSMSAGAAAWLGALDRHENRAFYKRAAHYWLFTYQPRALHLADCSGALLQPRDPLYGRWSRQFLAWCADEAARKGWVIGADGTITRTRQATESAA
jgi:hypothetical protein